MAPPKDNIVPMVKQTAPPRTIQWPSFQKALIDKPIQSIAPTLMVQNEMNTVPTDTVTQKTTSTPRVHRKSQQVPPTITQSKIHDKIREAASSRARLPHRTHMQLRQQEQWEHVQVICDDNTGEYLNYQQLMCIPKHRTIWAKSPANEFGRLAQGLPDGRVTGTNTIFFIHRDLVPKDWLKDVT